MGDAISQYGAKALHNTGSGTAVWETSAKALGAWCVGDRMALRCIVGVLQQMPGA